MLRIVTLFTMVLMPNISLIVCSIYIIIFVNKTNIKRRKLIFEILFGKFGYVSINGRY